MLMQWSQCMCFREVWFHEWTTIHVQTSVALFHYILFNHRLYSHPTATYESGGTRWFHRGRTDTIRSCTNAAYTFIKNMADPMAAVSEIYDINVISFSGTTPPSSVVRERVWSNSGGLWCRSADFWHSNHIHSTWFVTTVIQWNLSIEDLWNKDTSLFRTLPLIPAT